MPSSSVSSSSDSDEDLSKIALLKSATDTSFINDSMFKNVGKQNSSTENQKSSDPTPPIKKTTEKSQRYLEYDDTKNTNDLIIPESMQNFVYKKLSQKIADQIEFIDYVPYTPLPSNVEESSDFCVVKLLNDTEPIKITDWSTLPDITRPQKRQKIRKRKLSNDIIENSLDQRLTASVITPEEIVKEVSNWKNNKKVKNHFRYTEIQSKCYLIEPETEFTKLRKKNNWNENKIAR